MRVLVLLMVFVLSIFAKEKELYIYNWSEYMPESVLEEFTKETGIKINYSTYDSNEEMYEKITTSPDENYDIIFPSTYFINKMSENNLLLKIDHTKLSNYKNLNPKLLSKFFDPNNDYSIPYMWGSTGITYNSAEVYSPIHSWADLWNKKYKASVLLNDDMREVFGMALKVLGYSANSTNPKEIDEAYYKLVQLKPNIKVYDSESQKDYYLQDKVKLGMSFNGEGFAAKKDDNADKFAKMIFDGELSTKEENKELIYVYPTEGVIVWMDSMVIYKNSKNVENAHIFINYLLRAQVAKSISQKLGYASPNSAAVSLLSRSITKNRTIYPNSQDLRNAEFLINVDEVLHLYKKYWKMLKDE